MKTRITKRPGDWVFLLLVLVTSFLVYEGVGLPWWAYPLAAGALGFLLNLLHALIQERRDTQRFHQQLETWDQHEARLAALLDPIGKIVP